MSEKTVKVCAVSDAALLKELGRNAEVICARCGARSHNKNNVCEPIAIEADH